MISVGVNFRPFGFSAVRAASSDRHWFITSNLGIEISSFKTDLPNVYGSKSDAGPMGGWIIRAKFNCWNETSGIVTEFLLFFPEKE